MNCTIYFFVLLLEWNSKTAGRDILAIVLFMRFGKSEGKVKTDFLFDESCYRPNSYHQEDFEKFRAGHRANIYT